MPEVSIVVPCYKVEPYLDRCVSSLVNQTLKDIEIILVDDESPDRVPQMCDDWALKDSRIKVVHKRNGGLGMACNSGIESATGRFIAFCDSDDWVDPDCYETLLKAALQHGADAVYSGIKRVDQHGTVSPMSQPPYEAEYAGRRLEEFMLGMIATEPSDFKERERQMSAKIVLYSATVIRSNKIRFHSEREYISEDLLFNLDFLACCNKVVEIPRSFYYYFVNTASLSQTFRKDRFEKYKQLRKYMLNYYDFGSLHKDFTYRVDKMIIGYTRNTMNRIVASNESFVEKYRLINDICRDSLWRIIANEFPITKLPFNKKLIYYLTKKNLTIVLMALFKFKLSI